MDDLSRNFFSTPFRLKESIYENLNTTMDRSSIGNVFDEKKNFHTPKHFSINFSDDSIFNAPKKAIPHESKITQDTDILNVELFGERNQVENEENDELEKIKQIRGALLYYKLDNLFVLQGFLEWLVSFEDIRALLFQEIIGSFLSGFNERSRSIYSYFSKGTFVEIIGVELDSVSNTLSFLSQNIKAFSSQIEKSQAEARNEKIFLSIQGTCLDHTENEHQFILSVKVSPMLELLKLDEALLKDVLRCDFIKIKIFN